MRRPAFISWFPMYGTSLLWKSWIQDLRSAGRKGSGAGSSLPALRAARGLTQVQIAARLGISQSDVSRLERRGDLKISTLNKYVEAVGGRLQVSAEFADGKPVELQIGTGAGEGPVNPL